MVATAPEKITIDNIGPIQHLELPAAPGTITVLRGQNGCGKSTALSSVAALTRGEGRLTSRDGTTGGTAEGFGVTIRVGRGGANRRTGDLTIEAVEDKLSIADFVEPNVKDPIAADARRLKALISLAGVTADPTIYHDICGGESQFNELITPQTIEATDPIVMAERVKRDLESASRLYNQRAERLFGEYNAKIAANKDLDLHAESEAGVLGRKLEMAQAELAAMRERAKLAVSVAEKRGQAQAALDKATAEGGVQSLENAQQSLAGAIETREQIIASGNEIAELIQNLRDQLRTAETKFSLNTVELKAADSQIEQINARIAAAKNHEATLATWRKTLEDTPAIQAPSADQLAAAEAAVAAARSADHQGVLIRDGLKRVAEATELDGKRKAAVKHSEQFRDAAKSVLDVLAEQVKTLVPGIKLDPELRIVVPHPIRTECFYSDLSHGERWKLALDIAVASFRRLGIRGVLAIPQEAWEGLDGRNRLLLADLVAETDLIVFTAEAARSVESNGMEVEVVRRD